jgi:hypothetical protein
MKTATSRVPKLQGDTCRRPEEEKIQCGKRQERRREGTGWTCRHGRQNQWKQSSMRGPSSHPRHAPHIRCRPVPLPVPSPPSHGTASPPSSGYTKAPPPTISAPLPASAAAHSTSAAPAAGPSVSPSSPSAADPEGTKALGVRSCRAGVQRNHEVRNLIIMRSETS